MLWLRRRRRRRKLSAVPPPEEHEPQERPKEQNENWIKSHFSRLSEEKLAPGSSIPAPQPETINREANTTSREPFPSKQKAPGYSGARETHKESSSTDEATWAAVAATTKELDNKGHQLANSMLQRAMVYRNSGHLEAKDINQEDLKALQEMEIKLKGNFLTQRETTVAGMNHTHTFQGHGHHGHQDHPSHPNHHQSHSLPTRSHQTYHPFEAT